MGFGRDLSVWEIVEQALIAAREADDQAARLSNVVFMGMGEPMQNLPAVFGAIEELHRPAPGLGISARQIAVSTVGWVPGIAALQEFPLPVRLAVSLHAADDETRSRMMPINQRYPIASLLSACRRYCDKTGRRVFIEYRTARRRQRQSRRRDAAGAASARRSVPREPDRVQRDRRRVSGLPTRASGTRSGSPSNARGLRRRCGVRAARTSMPPVVSWSPGRLRRRPEISPRRGARDQSAREDCATRGRIS